MARGLRHAKALDTARIVTKGGMSRADSRWIPDGRAKTIRADCEASLTALDGLDIDLYLIHAPDPGTPWKTSVRALARLVDEGLVRRVGVANVNRRQLDEALELAPVAAVQVALSVCDDSAVRGGIVERCEEAGIAVIAHSPLGGRAAIGPPRTSRARRGRARLAARALPRRRCDPRRSSPRDRSLGRARGHARVDRRRSAKASEQRVLSARGAAPPAATSSS